MKQSQDSYLLGSKMVTNSCLKKILQGGGEMEEFYQSVRGTILLPMKDAYNGKNMFL
jgi:hypothetical protein